MKPKLLYYTDCPSFAGCEMVLVNLCHSKSIQNRYEQIFSYRYSREYQIGMRGKFSNSLKKFPLYLINANVKFTPKRNSPTKTFLNKMIGKFIHISASAQMLFQLRIAEIFDFIYLFFFFKKIKPDILHINNGGYPAARTCLIAVFAARLSGIRDILFQVNNLAYKRSNFSDKKIDEFINKSVRFFITASKQAKQYLIINRNFDEYRILQIYNAIQQPKLMKKREELLKDIVISPEKFIIVNVALLIKRKGQIFLLKALKTIRDTDRDIFSDTVLILVGNGEDRTFLENYVFENHLEKNVYFAGYRNNYYDFINAGDLFVLPSISHEDMPLVILSAMNLKKPIISTDLAGISEEIENEVEGVLLQPNELFKLPDQITRFYLNRKLGAEYGNNAYKKYKMKFDYNQVITQYLHLYDRLNRRYTA